MADSSHSCIHLLTAWSGGDNHQCRISHNATPSFRYMGKYIGDHGYDISCHTIFTTDLDDLQPWACRKFEHTNDANSDPRKLCLVC
jgi:hypothetical protein